MTTPAGLVLLGTLLLSLLRTIQANEATPCYAPNSDRIDDRFMPCISMEGMDSMCCRLNDTDPDICQPNGLCYWENVMGGGKEGPYRGLCTRQNWDTPNCLPKTMCDDASGGRSDYTGRLYDCHNERYCCGNSSDCCTEDKMFTISPTLVPIRATAHFTATATATVTIKPDASAKVAIGLGVGIPLGVLAIAGAGGGFLWGRRSVQARYGQLQNPGFHVPLGVYAGGDGVQHADSKPVHEADVVHPQPSELPAGRNGH